MWTRWKTIHESYGMPRAVYGCRAYLETRGIRVRLRVRRRGVLHVYTLQVPASQKREAAELLEQYKAGL